jgi:hypothetical protein
VTRAPEGFGGKRGFFRDREVACACAENCDVPSRFGRGRLAQRDELGDKVVLRLRMRGEDAIGCSAIGVCGEYVDA